MKGNTVFSLLRIIMVGCVTIIESGTLLAQDSLGTDFIPGETSSEGTDSGESSGDICVDGKQCYVIKAIDEEFARYGQIVLPNAYIERLKDGKIKPEEQIYVDFEIKSINPKSFLWGVQVKNTNESFLFDIDDMVRSHASSVERRHDEDLFLYKEANKAVISISIPVNKDNVIIDQQKSTIAMDVRLTIYQFCKNRLLTLRIRV